MAYMVSSTGHDVPLLNLNTITPQPRSRGIQATRRSYAADGSVHESGLYIELVFDFKETPTDYQTLLTTFGLSATVATNDVTVLIPNPAYSETRYNGTAVRPEVGRDVARENMFLRDIVILIRDLEAAS